MYDDDLDDDWGYNGNADHDMWVDYTTDLYEGTDYSSENPEYDVDLDAEYEPNIDYHHEVAQQYIHCSTHRNGGAFIPLTAKQYEHRIHKLEGLIAVALASAATLDMKAAKASSSNNIRKYQRRASEKQSEAKRYQDELDKLKRTYETAKLETEVVRTRILIVICAIVCLIATLIAVLY